MRQEIAGSRSPEEHVSVGLVSAFMITIPQILVYGHYMGSQEEWLTLIILASHGRWENHCVTKTSLNLHSEFQNSLYYIGLVSLTKKNEAPGKLCRACRMCCLQDSPSRPPGTHAVVLFKRSLVHQPRHHVRKEATALLSAPDV